LASNIQIFIVVYLHINSNISTDVCGLWPAGDPINFHGAFAFSLETATMVGCGQAGDIGVTLTIVAVIGEVVASGSSWRGGGWRRWRGVGDE